MLLTSPRTLSYYSPLDFLDFKVFSPSYYQINCLKLNSGVRNEAPSLFVKGYHIP